MDTGQQLGSSHYNFPSTVTKNKKKVHFKYDLNVLDQDSEPYPQLQHESARSKIYGEYLKPEMALERKNQDKLFFIEDFEHSESSSNGHKSKKNVYSGNNLESLPIFKSQKTLLGRSVFQTRELTTESVESSESLDRNSTTNVHLLPLCSVSHFNQSRYDHQLSFGSEESHKGYQYQGLNARSNHAKTKYSSQSQEIEEIFTICQHCTSLFDKCRRLQAENRQILAQNFILNEQLAKYEQIGIVGYQNHQFLDEERQFCPQHIKQLFLLQMEESYKTLLKINLLLTSYEIDFCQDDCRSLQRFWCQFKPIELTVICKQARQSKKQQIQQIHSIYKQTIARIIKKFEQKQYKKEADFKRFMTVLSAKHMNEVKYPSLNPAKIEKHFKKSKTYAQRQSSTDEDFKMTLIKEDKQKLEWLQSNYQHEKERLNCLQKTQKEKDKRNRIQISELIQQKDMLKNQLQRYQRQFSIFITKLSQNPLKKQPLCLGDSQFFKNLSQRIFQISNCIPFEQNDEQSLFAPENEVQLFEMIERIRKFYLKFQDYNKARDSSFQTQRNFLIILIKDLIRQSKMPEQKVVDMLSDKKYEHLAYIRELISSLKHKIRKCSTMKESKIIKSIQKPERTHSFMLDSCFPRP